jgi:hypothetical protein
MSSDLRRALLVVLLVGCADLERGPAAPDATAPPDPAPPGEAGAPVALAFARDVHPLLLAGCRSCHAPRASAGNTALVYTGDAAADLAASLPFVDRLRPGSSRLLSKGAGVGHGGGALYPAGSPEYEQIRQWIEQGTAP